MATFAQDSFTDTDSTVLTSHTPEVGGGWTAHPSNGASDAVITSNRVAATVFDGTKVYVYYNNGTPISADYYVQCKFRRTDTLAAGSAHNVTIRMSTSATTFYQLGYAGSTTGWQVYRFLAGTPVQIGSTTSATLTLNQEYTLKIDATGTTLTPTVDGSAVCGTTISDANITAAGKAGIRFAPGNSTTLKGSQDDFLAVDTATGSPWYYYANAS